MGNTQASTGSPLKCILSHWDQSDPQTLKKRQLIFFCTQAWPQYSLSDGKKWPPEGSTNYNTILQLDLFCKREGKWSEIPYVQAFFSLKNTQLGKACNLHPTGGTFSLPPNPSFPIAPLPINDNPPLISPAQKKISKEISKAPKTTRLLVMSPSSCRGRIIWPNPGTCPFLSLSDLKQIKVDLGKFSDDPHRYTDVLQGLGQTFNLAWRDIMLLLDQTLAFNEKNAALAAAREFGDTWYVSHVKDRMIMEKRDKFPTGQQAIPSMDLHWDLDSDHGDWSHKHLLTCVLEGLRRIRKKPMNYSMMSTITQGKEENPSAFLKRLWEVLRKYTPLSPESLEGQLVLKDKFITQSATDIRRKLQKQALGP
uniref:Core shell protein Gag P30 domain-containing protein n=1 Tax=Macaca fascicularis TaxID=9541 RepID=A0A7N9CM58_MACFA